MDLMNWGIYTGSSILVGMGAYIVRSLLGRLENLEKEMPQKMTGSDVRQFVQDKMDPIKADLEEIKQQLQKLYEMYVNDIKSK